MAYLRGLDDFGEDVEFFRDTGRAADQHIDDFLEIEQPERQLQVARIENKRALAEAAAVLVVNVEQKDTKIGARFENFIQEQRNTARFADARAAEHGEMLTEHFLDVDIGDDRRILLQRADVYLIRSRRRVDRSQILVGDQIDGIADRRIVGDAALKTRARRAAEDFAKQIDGSDGNIVCG